MRGFGRAGWAGLAVVALVLAAGAATGAQAKVKVTTVKNESLSATGSLTYTWNGAPARGCAAVGMCGTHGELILRPEDSGAIVSPVTGPFTVFLSQTGAVRVVREQGGAVIGECTDVPVSSSALLNLNPSAHRATTAAIEPPPSSGRCAGPTGNDLAAVPVPVRPARGGSFDLSGTRSFTAGPFNGTLVSTMRLVAAPAPQGEGFSSSSSGPGRPVQTAQAPITEFVALQYRVSAPSSTIQTQFTGAADPTCQIVDACGTSGSLAFSVRPSRTFTVIAERVVPRALNRRQVLNDLRQGRLSVSLFELLTARVAETINWPDGSSCRDAVAKPSLLLNGGFSQRASGKIAMTLTANGGPGTSVFRTHCPGPDDVDLFGEPANGQSQIYAQGSITTRQLLAKRSVLTLSESGSFDGLGYTGNHAGLIKLNLALANVTTHTAR